MPVATILTNDLRKGTYQLYDLDADPYETRDLSSEQEVRVGQMKTKLLAWNATVDASFAGEDYAEAFVTLDDPEPQFWYEAPAYRRHLPQWRDRWEFKSYMEHRHKVVKRAQRDK